MLYSIIAITRVMHDIKLPQEKKKELVSKRLKKVLVSAYRHVPYYRDMMINIGYNPELDYKGPQDLKNFPITKKQDIKKNNPLIFLKESVLPEQLHSTETTGSTGTLLKIFLSDNELAFRTAKWLRVLFVNKYSVRDKVLALASPAADDESKKFLQNLGLLRRLAIDELLDPKKHLEIFLNYKPHVLYGGRSPIDLLAMELIKKQIKPKGLKLLIVGGEIIYEHNKNLYRKAFGIDPVEYYGSEEMGIMAYETPARDGLHISDDLTYFEFLGKDNNPAKEGESARIVVTDLLGTTMPFIRYEQGDMVKIKVIADYDEKPVRRISEIIGRDNDYIILESGKKLFFSYFYNVIFKFNEIWQVRITQKTKTFLEVKIATSQDNFSKIEAKIKAQLTKNFPERCFFYLTRVDYIEPDPNGKLCMIVSEIRD